ADHSATVRRPLSDPRRRRCPVGHLPPSARDLAALRLVERDPKHCSVLSCRSPLPSRSPLSSAPAVGSLPRRPRRTISVDRSWIPHGVGGRQRALTAYDGAQAGRRQLAASWSPEFARRVDRSSGPPPWNHVPSPSPTVRAAGGAVARRHPAAPHGAPSRATATPLLIGPDAAGCRPEHPLHPRAIAVLYTVYVLQLKWLSNHVGKSRGFAPDIGAMTRVPGQ